MAQVLPRHIEIDRKKPCVGVQIWGGGGGICVKWVPFVKLTFSLGNRAHFGSKMDLFSAFSHYVFKDCGPNRGCRNDFALSPILTL